MNQYYILAKDELGRLRYMYCSGENINQIKNDFRNATNPVKITEILNFAIRIRDFETNSIVEPEPDWFAARNKTDDEQLNLFDMEAIS